MYSKLIIIIILSSLSISFGSDSLDHHFRLYITGDVKGETEPCG